MRKYAIFLLVLSTVLASGHSRASCRSTSVGDPVENDAISQAMKVYSHALGKSEGFTRKLTRVKHIAAVAGHSLSSQKHISRIALSTGPLRIKKAAIN